MQNEPYSPTPPRQVGIHTLKDIKIRAILPYIEWKYFFHAWQLPGTYTDIENICDCAGCEQAWLQKTDVTKREKAKEALNLYKEARIALKNMIDSGKITIRALFGIYPAQSADEGIYITDEIGEKHYIPTLRQQEKKETAYLSLCDFISPKHDYIGIFAVSINGADEMEKEYQNEGDMYDALLIKSLADRLAEATAEWLHEQIRKKYWGYAKNETLSVEDMRKSRYQGIRPAVGYPSLPDQSLIFRLNNILPLERIDITLTENGAMHPNASICGLMIAHPQAFYFNIGKIDKHQLLSYAQRSGKSIDEMRKWLQKNIT